MGTVIAGSGVTGVYLKVFGLVVIMVLPWLDFLVCSVCSVFLMGFSAGLATTEVNGRAEVKKTPKRMAKIAKILTFDDKYVKKCDVFLLHMFIL